MSNKARDQTIKTIARDILGLRTLKITGDGGADHPAVWIGYISTALEKAYDAGKRYERAHAAVSDAMDALKDTAPNGRDYYPQGAAAIEEAQHEHAKRMEALRRVYAELTEIIVVLDQGGPSCTSR